MNKSSNTVDKVKNKNFKQQINRRKKSGKTIQEENRIYKAKYKTLKISEYQRKQTCPK